MEAKATSQPDHMNQPSHGHNPKLGDISTVAQMTTTLSSKKLRDSSNAYCIRDKLVRWRGVVEEADLELLVSKLTKD